MSRRLYLVRHGATTANREGRYIGWDEHALSPEGLAQAEKAAQHLARLAPASLVTSDLRRCRETAAAIARATGLRPAADRRLRELDFGRFSGLTYAEIAAAWPAALAAWLADPERVAPPGGETQAVLRRRVMAALPRTHKAVAVTHGGVIRTVLAHLTGRDFFSWAVPPGGVVALSWDGERLRQEPETWQPR